jgi:NAD(P)H dehydrogenase (quinone)
LKAHILFAHPNLQSFNGALRNAAIDALKQKGYTITTADLHQINFKAGADERDFISLVSAENFDIQLEQKMALQLGTFTNDIKREQQLLAEADLIVMQFPLWWYSMPALLKGYIDRVFSMGWAYGGAQALAGKKVLVCSTTGAPEFAWTADKRGTVKEIFKHLFIGVFELCGLQATEPFFVYCPKRMTDEERAEVLSSYVKHINLI